MKTMGLWRWLLATLISTVAVSGLAANLPGVKIEFDNPKYFTDIRIHDFNEFKSANIFAEEMNGALAPIVAKAAPGCTLVLHFTDIDLGGRYEPWKPQHSQIRYDRQTLPLRMTFNYTLLDSKGRTLSSGRKSVTDAIYTGRAAGATYQAMSDYLYYEKQALARWVQQNIRNRS